MSVSGVYTGRMHVPHLAPDFSVIPENYEYSYIRKDELVHTPDFFDLNLKLNYTFVLNDHIKLQLNGGVQNLFNAFQKIWIREVSVIPVISMVPHSHGLIS